MIYVRVATVVVSFSAPKSTDNKDLEIRILHGWRRAAHTRVITATVYYIASGDGRFPRTHDARASPNADARVGCVDVLNHDRGSGAIASRGDE